MKVRVTGAQRRHDPHVRIPNEVLGRVSGSEMTVFTLLTWLDRKGKGVRTSVSRLSGGTGLSAPTVHSALCRLEEKRLISYFPGKAPSDPWTYHVLLRPGKERYFVLPLSHVNQYSGNELLVVGQLSCCSNAYGVAYPSHRWIAAALHLAANTVRSCLQTLKEKNALEMVPRLYKSTRARRSFVYRLLFWGGVSKIYMPVSIPTKERKDRRDKKEVERNSLTLKRLYIPSRARKMATRILQKIRQLFRKKEDPERCRGRDPCRGAQQKKSIFFFVPEKGGHL